MPPTKTWKSKERTLASLFGTMRRALSGGNSNSGGRDDVKHPRLFIECKYRKEHAIWALWRQCVLFAGKELKLRKRRVVIALYERQQEGCLLVVHQNDIPLVVSELIEAKDPRSPLADQVRQFFGLHIPQ